MNHRISYLSIGYAIMLVTLSVYTIMLKSNYPKVELTNNEASSRLSSFENDLIAKASTEGYFITDILNMDYKEENHILSDSKKGSILISAGIIDCFSCFEFHIEHINALIDMGITTIIYSPTLAELISSHLKDENPLIIVTDENPFSLLSYGMVISYVDTNGIIQYSDVADPANYDKSKHFYNRLRRIIE